ncbi:phosphatase PAP2 family protein [Sphingomonas sp. HHU CXW]|uniref:Phosphatase PAP2 family protein n=1 Tax=Sphingomonas hominis TaxID=2741495 RepID=A0ABX2JI84_9SPHN|nr:phosphatase PAP2 family protein [Sphingomonas hominis]NTS65479.1 phosphatase PAP2 family protein [Sphingomonas hominis]
MDQRNEPTSDVAAWWLLAAMFAACLLVARGLGFRVDAWRAMPSAIALALLAGGAVIGRRRAQPRLAAGATAFLQMTLFTLIGVVLAYALAARAGALWDTRLAAADRALGFDWPAVFAAADRASVALWIGGLAYHSLTLQMVTCIVAMSAYAQFERLRVAVTAAILAGFATIVVSWWMPAMGNVVDPAGYTRLWPSIAWLEQAMIAGLRDGSWRTLDLTQLMGIVSFPSYHATLPVILSWAQRDTPGWRYVAPVWAGVTIVATPLFGGHYGVDVLAGLALAPAALAVAPWLARRRLRITLARRTDMAHRPSVGMDHGIG